jgi:hypothetical protein
MCIVVHAAAPLCQRLIMSTETRPQGRVWLTVAVCAMRPTRLKGAANSIAHSHTVHAIGNTSMPLRWQVTRFQDGRGGRGGDGGSPTQEICRGPAINTLGENAFEGSAWNLDDEEEPDREGPFIDIYNI